jgi:hypothetical protein
MASGTGALPRPAFAQLLGVELAATAVVGGLALGGAWSVAGIAVGAALALLVLVPLRRRWLYAVAASWWRWTQRRRGAAPGLAGALGSYRVESVPGGRKGPAPRMTDTGAFAGGVRFNRGDAGGAAGSGAATIGVVRTGDVWTVPLLLGLDDVLGADAGAPLATLAELLEVDDVPLAELRLLTVSTPARVTAQAPAAPEPPVDQFAARYLLLAVDGRRAADALAARGGDRPAVEQVVRRCVVAAEQAMANVGVGVRRLDEGAVAGLFAAWMGPAAPTAGRRASQSVESWRDVRVAGTWSMGAVVAGPAAEVVERAQRLAAAAPTPIVATAVVLRPGRRGRPLAATLVLRFSAPDMPAAADAAAAIGAVAQGYGLSIRPQGGEQLPLLRLTSPVGGSGPAAGGVSVAPDDMVPAPPTGVAVGRGAAGTVHLRLFRPSGTRVVLGAGRDAVRAAHLLALRAAASGIPVEVVTARPQMWQPLIGHGPGSRIRTPDEPARPSAGPMLLIDDRPGDAASQCALGGVRAWQCRLEVRGPAPESDPTAGVADEPLGSVARADLVVLGAVSPEIAAGAVAAFGVSPEVGEVLPHLEPGTCALLRPGRVDYVALDAGAAEQALLDAAARPASVSWSR